MSTLQPSRNVIFTIERIAGGGLLIGVALLCVITAATLVYAWFLA